MQSIAVTLAFAIALSLAVPYLTPVAAQQNMQKKKKGLMKKKNGYSQKQGWRYKNPMKQ